MTDAHEQGKLSSDLAISLFFKKLRFLLDILKPFLRYIKEFSIICCDLNKRIMFFQRH